LAFKTIEEYTEVIYTLEMRSGRAHTTDIASILNVKPPSVTEMLQKLHDMDLVIYEPYRGAKLTPPGMKMAEELMQSHKTLVEFFEIIGIDNETAEIDACQIEHHVAAKTMKQLRKFTKFVQNAPCEPLWLKHFEYFDKTGKWKRCNLK
jgi:DtxR family Mn-dependent transcriptional regulator